MLVGEKIILRPLKISDLEKVNLWRNNLELVKLTQGIRFPKTLEMDKAWFDRALNDTTNTNIYFGIDEIESKDFIGLFQLINIDYISRTAIWGYVIGEKNKQKLGYGTIAGQLILNYAFNVLNLRKIYSYNLVGNEGTLKMQKKLGFGQEGMLKEHLYFGGEYHDVIILSICNSIGS